MTRNNKKISLSALTFLLSAALLCLCSGCGGSAAAVTGEPPVRINEVISSNSYYAPLPDGSYCDWVEFYNCSEKAVNLRGYALSDDDRKPLKWKFREDFTLEPGGYGVVFLSGLNKVDEDGNLHTSFRLSADGENLIFSAPDGELLQMLEVPACNINNVSYGIDERSDSGEYVWMAEPSPGYACSCDTASSPGNLKYSSNGVIINEYVTGNTYVIYDSEGEYSDWIELYNTSETDACMDGCSLSDSADGSKWYFPVGTVIPPGGYLLIFCDDKPSTENELHASFRLSGGDGCITLFSSSGVPSDDITVYGLPDNVSCGIDPESGEERLYTSPTPGRANDTHPYELTDDVKGVPSSPVIISEALAVSSGRDESVSDYDFIELYNRSPESVSLEGFGISDNRDEVKFTFPNVVIAAESYLVIRCGGKDENSLCADFKLNCGGENIYLTDSDSHLLDVFCTGRQEANVCRGRLLSDLSRWYYFTEPTPGKENSADSTYSAYAEMPVFSSSGGYVNSGYVLSIAHRPDSTVYYTTDGSVPDSSANVYNDAEGVVIDKTMVVRAVCIKDGLLDSEIATASFFTETPIRFR